VSSAVALMATTLLATACLPDVDAPPPTTMPDAAPPTTLVPIDLGGATGVGDELAEFTGTMLDGREVTVRSDDPNVRFVDGEPAEIRRITDLATDGECEQLHTTLEFWLAYLDDEPGSDAVNTDTDTNTDTGTDTDTGDTRTDVVSDQPVTTGERASLFGRAAYDAIVFVGCT
jgi:hypothetical protein